MLTSDGKVVSCGWGADGQTGKSVPCIASISCLLSRKPTCEQAICDPPCEKGAYQKTFLNRFLIIPFENCFKRFETISKCFETLHFWFYLREKTFSNISELFSNL